MARVGLNLLYLVPGVGGTETYALNLAQALDANEAALQYSVFVSRDGRRAEIERLRSTNLVILRFRARRRIVRYLWEQVVLPVVVRQQKIDLLHSLGYVAPIFAQSRSVVTVHDANFARLRSTMGRIRSSILEWFVRRSVERATAVITVSEFSKQELMQCLGVGKEKVRVIYEAGRMDAVHDGPKWEEVARRWELQKPYILAFGGGQHKNLGRLIMSLRCISDLIPVNLVIVGGIGREGRLNDLASRFGIGDRVAMTGYVSDPDLKVMLREAEVMAFPSLYEGFGLPVLEAQQLGIPVVCSNRGSLPEVAGGAALLVDPLSITEIADGIAACLKDQRLRTSLREKGYRNVGRFSWRETARRTIGVYQEVLEGRM